MDRRKWLKLSTSAAVAIPMIAPSTLLASNKIKTKERPICVTCGVQYENENQDHCPVCEDSRQYVNHSGQKWTNFDSLTKTHRNIIEKVAPNIYAIHTVPDFGIGQRAHLVISPEGNVLWDCISNLDESTIEIVNKLGGIKAIAISHPHYYSTMVEWSKVFDTPIYLHKNDKSWIQRKDQSIKLWEGREMKLWDGMKLILCRGHFDGATVMHTSYDGGQLLTGDNPLVGSDLKSLTFMYSYPNYIPLSAKDVLYIKQSLDSLDYKSIYSAFGKYILNDGKKIMNFSISRFLKQVQSV